MILTDEDIKEISFIMYEKENLIRKITVNTEAVQKKSSIILKKLYYLMITKKNLIGPNWENYLSFFTKTRNIYTECTLLKGIINGIPFRPTWDDAEHMEDILKSLFMGHEELSDLERTLIFEDGLPNDKLPEITTYYDTIEKEISSFADKSDDLTPSYVYHLENFVGAIRGALDVIYGEVNTVVYFSQRSDMEKETDLYDAILMLLQQVACPLEMDMLLCYIGYSILTKGMCYEPLINNLYIEVYKLIADMEEPLKIVTKVSSKKRKGE